MQQFENGIYKIKVDNFEGSLDLLINLIRNSKVNINDLLISDITREFINFINDTQNLNIELMSNFIYNISSLLYLKSKILFPQEVEIDENQIDDREEFIENIIEYQKYKNIAQTLKEKIENENILIRNDSLLIIDNNKNESWEEVSVIDLLMAFSKIATEVDKSVFKAFELEEISIDDKINEILEYLIDNNSIMFDSLFQSGYSKYELIITFLALLELIKIRKVFILQNKIFGKIKIFKKKD